MKNVFVNCKITVNVVNCLWYHIKSFYIKNFHSYLQILAYSGNKYFRVLEENMDTLENICLLYNLDASEPYAIWNLYQLQSNLKKKTSKEVIKHIVIDKIYFKILYKTGSHV